MSRKKDDIKRDRKKIRYPNEIVRHLTFMIISFYGLSLSGRRLKVAVPYNYREKYRIY